MVTAEGSAATPAADRKSESGVAEHGSAETSLALSLEQAQSDEDGPLPSDVAIPLAIILPLGSDKLQITVYPHEQIHEIRQSIMELPPAIQYTCFHLELDGQRIPDFVSVSEVKNLVADCELRLVEDAYTERDARIHFVRIRELIGAAGDRPDSVQGILAGTSLFDSLDQSATSTSARVYEYDLSSPPSISPILAKTSIQLSLKTIKSIALSAWNPPPCHLRQKGHLLYISLTTNEGDQYQITGHVGGFYLNRSLHNKFDPSPRAPPKNVGAHSLLTLLGDISPLFREAFARLQESSSHRDPLSTFQMTNAIPASPWLVPEPSSGLWDHVADLTRTQESYLFGGLDNTDTLRDWNEEYQSAKELPKSNVADRVFRDRLMSKLIADYTDAAAKGAVLVGRGEVAPLNPTEDIDAQIFVYNNIFFSFGADGIGTFASQGGDEAARVATGKDVMGVALVNQFDIDGLFTPATVVVDYLGKRIVGQTIVPGIFKQREPGEHQIDYGAVDGKEVVASDDRFVPILRTLSEALHIKQHPVWDKTGKRFDLEASAETKGLLGTDGRKYVLDMYRITPIDILWLEECEAQSNGTPSINYPHRMTVLRPELIHAYVRHRRIEASADRPESPDAVLSSGGHEQSETAEPLQHAGGESGERPIETEMVPSAQQAVVGTGEMVPASKFALNPDAFSGQVPQTEEEKADLRSDEDDVRRACAYLRSTAIPRLLNDLRQSTSSFPVDGRALSALVHRRGINVRYIGKLASLSDEPQLACLRVVCEQDMISRSFKHIVGSFLRRLPLVLAPACIAHLLNCLLADGKDVSAVAVDSSFVELYPECLLTFMDVTAESLAEQIEGDVFRRFRYRLLATWRSTAKPLQLLREVSLRLGLQIQAGDVWFANQAKTTVSSGPNGDALGDTAVNSKDDSAARKKKAADRSSNPKRQTSVNRCFFVPDDIVNVVPVVKSSPLKSTLAEETLEAGKLSIIEGQRKLGQDLMLESLSLYEQIYGVLHPEVAQVYHTLSMMYHQLDEKAAAVELARKAVILSERTFGLDSAETLLYYLNLSLFLHHLGETDSALLYSRHAIDLSKLIFGADHPDTVTIINNAAVMLQQVREYHQSRLWFEQSLQICEAIFGKHSINCATLHFQLAQALALDNDSKGAVNRMRDSYNIFLAELGATDKNTKEAERWLEQLTHSAVAIAKNAKANEAGRIQSMAQFTTRAVASLNSRPGQLRAQASTNTVPSNGASDSRSIDELIKYIEGTDHETNSSKKRNGRKHPKTRVPRSTSTRT